ncbi:hybrid sensor histidine kinase/response regulator [Roseomonas xinghualingensis]|uniref:hybrid sensor histidine kinase/response regulator n=1 Tax=Roseomonas xinghualingensis TaxID=2986475 RepID=UPI0021F19C59|nr:ATP-binding protein [Roseomonas sp. SXEYE001]
MISRLSRHATWALTASIWLILSGVVWFVAEGYADRVEREAEAAALARAEVSAGAIEQNLLRILEAVEGLHDLAQSRQRLRENNDRDGAEAMEDQLAAVSADGRFGVLQVAVIGADGWLSWSSVPGWQSVELSDREHFRVHREGRQSLFVSAPLVGRTSDQWTVQLTRPLKERAGSFAGVAVVSIDPANLSQRLAELSLGAGSSALVLRHDGIILARSSAAQHALGQRVSLDQKALARLERSAGGRLRLERSALDGAAKLIGYRVLSDAPLTTAVGLDARQELTPTSFVRPALRAAAAAISLLALAVAGLSLLWIERRRTQADLELARREHEAALGRLAQAQRMEALGRLASGIAHDFNNVLQAVLGGAKVIQRKPNDAETARRFAGMIADAAERGASVTRRLLGFARRGELRADLFEIGPLLSGLREVLAHTLGTHIKVRIEADPVLPKILADRGQLETVLVNLAVNARDAMAARGGGTLTLSASVEEMQAPLDAAAGLPAGSYLRLRVSDTGSGMDRATLARAGEPFFTTKPKGKGTGLGLAMAKGFAEQSGGAIRIDSEPGRGTTVTLWLPRAAIDAVPEPRLPPSMPQQDEKAARILVVDDEPQVRAVLAAALHSHGHHVDEAHDGQTALTRLDGCDMLVTDLAMPGMNGLGLLRQARKRYPRLPAILITGYAGDAGQGELTNAAENGPFAMLHKPVDPDELARCVVLLLRAEDTGAGANSCIPPATR